MRKIITVPIDKDAAIALDYNEATPEQLIEVFLSEKEFKILWEMNFFALINQIAGSNIDNYEDEQIVDEQKLKKVLNSGVFDANYGVDKVHQIKKMFEEAISRKTNVHFFF